MRPDKKNIERLVEIHTQRRGAATAPLAIALMVLFAVLIAGGGLLYAYGHGWFGSQANAAGTGGSQIAQVEQALAVSCQGSDPQYTYSAVDSFAGGTVAGTDYIKNNDDYPVSSLAGPKAGAALQHWKSNATYFCPIGKKNAVCGTDTLQEKCFQNGTATVSVYDQDNRVTLSNSATAGTQNVTIGASETHNLEMDFQGSGNKAIFPFGGCVAVEYPSTMSPPVISGGLDGSACPYTWTYTVSSTSNTYKLFAIPAGWDTNLATGVSPRNAVNIQLKSTGTNPSGVVYLTTRSANNYLVTSSSLDKSGKSVLGTFALDLEQNLNGGSSTQTMPGQIQTVFAVN